MKPTLCLLSDSQVSPRLLHTLAGQSGELNHWQADQHQQDTLQLRMQMQDLFEQLSQSDLVVVDTNSQANSIAICIGYAVAIGKPVIGLRRKQESLLASATSSVAALVNRIIEYQRCDQIQLFG